MSEQVPFFIILIGSKLGRHAASYENALDIIRACVIVRTPVGASSLKFLASENSFYMTAQVLQPNGGEIVNG
jgi:hypothetical protein